MEKKMGECGCGEINNYEAFNVSDYILVVEKYLGCRYCHTGLMFSLHLFTKEEADTFQIISTKEFKPDEYGHTQLDFPVTIDESVSALRHTGELSEELK